MKNIEMFKVIFICSCLSFVFSIALFFERMVELGIVFIIISIFLLIIGIVKYKEREIPVKENTLQEVKESLTLDDLLEQYIEPEVIYNINSDYIDSGIRRTVRTSVRGTYYTISEDDFESIEVGDELVIKHSPSKNYPEETTIEIANFIHIGYLKKEIAEEFIELYGEGFQFLGEILDKKIRKDDYGEKNISIYIGFEVPNLIKIKKSKE